MAEQPVVGGKGDAELGEHSEGVNERTLKTERRNTGPPCFLDVAAEDRKIRSCLELSSWIEQGKVREEMMENGESFETHLALGSLAT